MKKNYLQKACAVALTGAMVMGSLAGCSKETTKKEETTTAQQTKAAEETTKAVEETTKAEETTVAEESTTVAVNVPGIEGWVPFAEKVTIDIPVYDRGQEGVPAIGENYWESWIQENFGDKYNIEIEFVPITRSDVLTSYALLAAAEDLPTILMEYDYPKQAQWAADGYLAEYDLDEFAQVAPTYYKRMEELGLLNYTDMNEKCYFALAERPAGAGWGSFVRMDWLRAVGYDYVPTTRADYLDAMTKIQEAGLAEHPAGGVMVSGAGIDQNYGYRHYPFDEEEWAMYGDYNIPSLGWYPNYELLKDINEEYNLGIINPEYNLRDNSTNEADFINGQVYSWGGYLSSSMPVLESFYDLNPDAELAVPDVMMVPDEEGGKIPGGRTDNPFGMMIGFSSQATDDEIKAAWMYMEWMIQEENLFIMQWGYENDNYTLDEKGLPNAVEYSKYQGEHKQGYNNNKDYWCIAKESRQAGTIEDAIRAVSPKNLPQDFTQDFIDIYYKSQELQKSGYCYLDCMFATEIPAVTEYMGELIEAYKVYRDTLTMCKPEEFDALYDQFAAEYAEMGYAEVAEQRLEAFKNGLTSRLPEASVAE